MSHKLEMLTIKGLLYVINDVDALPGAADAAVKEIKRRAKAAQLLASKQGDANNDRQTINE